MRKALHHADVSVQEMADYLDVARNTVSTWINDHIEPSLQTMRLWSLRTGVPLEWLLTGEVPATKPGDGLTIWSQLADVIPIDRDRPRIAQRMAEAS